MMGSRMKDIKDFQHWKPTILVKGRAEIRDKIVFIPSDFLHLRLKLTFNFFSQLNYSLGEHSFQVLLCILRS